VVPGFGGAVWRDRTGRSAFDESPQLRAAVLGIVGQPAGDPVCDPSSHTGADDAIRHQPTLAGFDEQASHSLSSRRAGMGPNHR
jgi:hypothetical protein